MFFFVCLDSTLSCSFFFGHLSDLNPHDHTCILKILCTHMRTNIHTYTSVYIYMWNIYMYVSKGSKEVTFPVWRFYGVIATRVGHGFRTGDYGDGYLSSVSLPIKVPVRLLHDLLVSCGTIRSFTFTDEFFSGPFVYCRSNFPKDVRLRPC